MFGMKLYGVIVTAILHKDYTTHVAGKENQCLSTSSDFFQV